MMMLQRLSTCQHQVRRSFAAAAKKGGKKGGKKGKQDTKKSARPQSRSLEGPPSRDDEYDVFKGIVDAPKMRRPKLDEETLARHAEIAKTYARNSKKMHNQFMGQLQLKLDLQQFALRSLPPDMRAHASQWEDAPPPPLDRRWLCWTPPIRGFDAREWKIDDEDDSS